MKIHDAFSTVSLSLPPLIQTLSNSDFARLSTERPAARQEIQEIEPAKPTTKYENRVKCVDRNEIQPLRTG